MKRDHPRLSPSAPSRKSENSLEMDNGSAAPSGSGNYSCILRVDYTLFVFDGEDSPTRRSLGLRSRRCAPLEGMLLRMKVRYRPTVGVWVDTPWPRAAVVGCQQ